MTLSLDALINGRQLDQLLPELSARFLGMGIDLECTYCQPTDKPALYLDLASSTHAGRLTLWISGECETEVLRGADGAQLINESLVIGSSDELLSALLRLAVFMREGPR